MRKGPDKISLHWKISLILVLTLAIFFTPGGLATAQEEEDLTLTGSWKNDLFLNLDDSDELLEYSSALSFDYELTSFTIGSLTRFSNTQDLTGLAEQRFEIDGRLGLFNTSSDVVFDTDETRLDYWLTETSFTFGGATLQGTFLLEYVAIPEYFPAFPGKFGAGAEIALLAAGDNGIDVDIRNRFGLKVSEAEVLGVTSGSGFDIDLRQFDSQGNPLSTKEALRSINNFHYVNTVAEIDGPSLGCCTFNTETKFSRDEGLEYVLLEFPIELTEFPLTIDTDLRFSPQTKSVIIDPELDVSFDCFTVYMDMLQDGSTETSYKPEIEGFELRQIALGPIQVSSITSLKGNLYRNYGTSNLKLRSYDYLIDPDKPLNYIPTPFDEVVSLETHTPQDEGYPSLDLGMDFYFDMSGSENLFDLSFVTMNAKTGLTSNLDIGTGVSFELQDGPTELLFEFDAYF